MRRLTWRQLRLIDWLQNPTHPDLAQDGAVDWSKAMWKVSDLARLSGVASPYTYARCRRDLRALSEHGLVTQLVPDRWVVGDVG